MSKYRLKCQIKARINRDGVRGRRVCGRSSVFKLQLQQEGEKVSWDLREDTRTPIATPIGASGRLLRLFVTDSAQPNTGWTPPLRRAEWNHGTFPHTLPRYAVHNRAVVDINTTVFQRYPNVPPLFELYSGLFSRLRRRSRCSKFFITVSTKLQTPAECTPDLATR